MVEGRDGGNVRHGRGVSTRWCVTPLESTISRSLTAFQYFHNIGNVESKTIVQAFGALAQETRLRIYRLLVTAGPEGLAAGVIAEKLDLPAATLSFHLRELNLANLVRSRQEGRFIFYCANFDTMISLVSFLTENCCGGNSCVPECQPKSTAKRRKVA